MDAKHSPKEKARHGPPRGRREYLELWMSVSKREWSSLILVPADRGGSTAEVANALADVGQRLSFEPVTAITVSSLEYGSALALADLQQHLKIERRGTEETVVAGTVEVAPAPADGRASAAGAAGTNGAAAKPDPAPRAAAGSGTAASLAVLPTARLIISVPPVVTEPLGLAAVHEADATILVIRMNQTRLSEVRRTVELVGRERVMGCFILR